MITLDNYAQQSLGSYQQRYKEDYETVDEVNKRIMENLKIKQSSEATKNPEEAKVPEPSSIQGMFCNFFFKLYIDKAQPICFKMQKKFILF